jgi:ankyrin repeat protein
VITALHIAADKGLKDMVSLLLERGADIEGGEEVPVL